MKFEQNMNKYLMFGLPCFNVFAGLRYVFHRGVNI